MALAGAWEAVLAFTRRSCRELGFSSAQDLHFGPSLQVARDQWTALLAIPVVHSVYPPASPRATSAFLESRSRPSASCLRRPGSDSGAEEGCDLPLRFTNGLGRKLILAESSRSKHFAQHTDDTPRSECCRRCHSCRCSLCACDPIASVFDAHTPGLDQSTETKTNDSASRLSSHSSLLPTVYTAYPLPLAGCPAHARFVFAFACSCSTPSSPCVNAGEPSCLCLVY